MKSLKSGYLLFFFTASFIFASFSITEISLADSGSTAKAGVAITSKGITEAEVLAAQQAWGDRLVAVSKAYDERGIEAAKAEAEKMIDEIYGYQLGVVLFKPTLACAPQTFRTTREGALSYFVGGNPSFPNDKGFALKGWRNVEIKNAAIFISGDTATTLGNVVFTDKNGKTVTVDKSWEFIKDDKGNLRIILHHSSLPCAETK